jgi:ParB-like chromosome segregation protein Spo0J
MSYMGLVSRNPAPLEKVVNSPEKHIIHKAIEWKRMLDEGIVKSLNEIAKRERLSRARVTQVMNLLKLPEEVKLLLARLGEPKEIRKYSERRLRNR